MPGGWVPALDELPPQEATLKHPHSVSGPTPGTAGSPDLGTVTTHRHTVTAAAMSMGTIVC